MYEVPLSRIDELADVAAEAFVDSDDPVGDFVFQNEPPLQRRLLKRQFFRTLVTACGPDAIRQANSPNLEAVSIWFPPGMAPLEDVHASPFYAEDFADPTTAARLEVVNEVVAALTRQLGAQPQWYLHLVAVRAPFRGHGYASRLVQPMLERARRDDRPATLITKHLETVPKYQRWGFRIVHQLDVPGSQAKFCSMRWSPGVHYSTR
jgi:GNAT superfamily N-acetyltransferase